MDLHVNAACDQGGRTGWCIRRLMGCWGCVSRLVTWVVASRDADGGRWCWSEPPCTPHPCSLAPLVARAVTLVVGPGLVCLRTAGNSGCISPSRLTRHRYSYSQSAGLTLGTVDRGDP